MDQKIITGKLLQMAEDRILTGIEECSILPVSDEKFQRSVNNIISLLALAEAITKKSAPVNPGIQIKK